MSGGITDMMRDQEKINDEIFTSFEFEESPIDGHMFFPIHKDVLVCWDYNYEYWYLEIKGGELKIYPKGAKCIEELIDIYSRS